MKLRHISARVLLCLPLLLVSAAKADTFILVNKDAGFGSMDKEQVKKVFLGKAKQWDNGVPVNACLEEADDAALSAFYKDYLGKSPSAYQAYWNRLLFSGKGVPPQTFGTIEEITAFVRVTKGAICFATVAGNIPENVVVLK